MNKRNARKIRQNRHVVYHEAVKREMQLKQAIKALPVVIKTGKRERVQP